MRTFFVNAELIFPDRITHGMLICSDGIIEYAGARSGAPASLHPSDEVINCEGKYLSPGFVELHTHGAGGADFMDGTSEAFEKACLTHLEHGTTFLLPTALSATKEEIFRSIDAFRQAKISLEGRGPELYGLHIEGPYLNPAQCGAMSRKFLRTPLEEEYEEILSAGKGVLKRWTFAVEYPGADRFARRLVEEGILPSAGHSDAEYAQVLAAYLNGVTHVTHLFSCMSTIKRVGGFRHSGLLESAFCIPDMTVEIIADGCHIPTELLNMVYRLKGPEKTALTCDSMRCAGQNVRSSVLGSLANGSPCIIEDGVAKLPDRSAFAGSVATDDRLVRVMTKEAGVPLYDAVRMMTLTPAEIIGASERFGSLEKGKDADLVLFDENINIEKVFRKGKLLYTKKGCGR